MNFLYIQICFSDYTSDKFVPSAAPQRKEYLELPDIFV